MAIWNEIKYSRMLQFQRFDGEYYKPENEIIIDNIIKSNKYSYLNTFITELTDGKHGGVTYTDGGVIFLRNQNIKNGFIDFTEKKYISKIESNESKRAELKSNDIVITTIGTLGEVAIVPECIEQSTINQNLVRVSIKNIDPYYLAIFLLTKYGNKQIIRLASGNVQPIIVYPNLKKILIFTPDKSNQLEIAYLFKKAIDKRESSESLYQQAQQLLEKELGLDEIVFKKTLSYEATFSKMSMNSRSDAEFYNPELVNYYSYLSKKFDLVKISEYARVMKFGNPTYSSSGIPIITQKHLQEITPEGYGFDLLADNDWIKNYPSAMLQKNDLLFYSVGAYLGKTNIWLNTDKAVPASFITMLRCQNEIHSGYLMVLLNSKFGILQSKVFQSGTSQQYIYPKDIRKFLIPQISDSLQSKFYTLIMKSQNAKNESQQLLKQAKRRVEELIEKAIEK